MNACTSVQIRISNASRASYVKPANGPMGIAVMGADSTYMYGTVEASAWSSMHGLRAAKDVSLWITQISC